MKCTTKLNNNKIVVKYKYMSTTTFMSMIAGQQPMPEWMMISPIILAILLVWSIIWKGIALWKSARLSQKWWFVILLIVNTFGILEIVYILFVAKKYKVETEQIEEKHL